MSTAAHKIGCPGTAIANACQAELNRIDQLDRAREQASDELYGVLVDGRDDELVETAIGRAREEDVADVLWRLRDAWYGKGDLQDAAMRAASLAEACFDRYATDETAITEYMERCRKEAEEL